MRGKKLDRLIRVETLNEIEKANSLKNQAIKEQAERFKIQTEIEKEKLIIKDRANISLKEYNEMKEKIKELQEHYENYSKLFNKLNLWEYIEHIDFDSIRVEKWEEPISCKSKIGISFELKRR
jgi:hypothetical protein